MLGDEGELFVQLYPRWRTVKEIEWCHRVASAASSMASEVVLPYRMANGSTALATPRGPVSIFPFLHGTALDTDSSELRAAAAELLARLHLGMQTSPLVHTVRPSSAPEAPLALRDATARDELQDRELDRWEDELPNSTYVRGFIHGDYYRGNILSVGSRIVGIVDWLEADFDLLSQELGWSIWEFSKNDPGDDLIDERAQEFLATYLRGGGSVSGVEIDALVPFIRRRLRREVGRARVAATRGEPWDLTYTEAEVRAFRVLAGKAIELPA